MFKNYFFIFFFFLFSQNLFSKTINFKGLSKFNLDDIQSITSIDIYNNNLD